MSQAGHKPASRFMDLQFAIQEFEEEADARDLTHMAKTTKPIAASVQHS
jgi:hypothetical protein